MEAWDEIIALRESFADRAESFTEDQWNAPSLCTGWRVRDVAAHMILPERFPLAQMLPALAKARFNLNRLLAADAIRRGSVPIPDLLAAYREGIHRRTAPPTRTARNILADLMVHCQDIFRPLDLTHAYSPDVLRAVAESLHGDRAIGVPRRVSGLRLTAVDIDWSAGDGPEITGPAEPIILAITGRPEALADLTGPGLPALASRIGRH